MMLTHSIPPSLLFASSFAGIQVHEESNLFDGKFTFTTFEMRNINIYILYLCVYVSIGVLDPRDSVGNKFYEKNIY
jgi:hypothetical protein